MNIRDFDTSITEAPMNPNEFAKANEVGQSEGVLVGYEFEICIPAAYMTNYAEIIIIDHLKHNDSIFDEIQITPDTISQLDQLLVPIQKKKPKYSSFNEAIRGKSEVEFSDIRGTVAELMCKMFPIKKDGHDCINAIADKFDKYFEIVDAKTLYNLLTDMGADLYGDEEDSYHMAAEKLAGQIQTSFNTEVNIFVYAHEFTKKLDRWHIEPDESLVVKDHSDASLEVVTPPMPAREAVQVLKDFYQLAKRNNFYTGKQYSTGLHINVSIPKTLDVLKLALFLGDQYLLKLFDREDIEYVWSLKKGIDSSLSDYDDLVKTNIKKKGKKVFTQNTNDLKKLKAIANKISDDHYASINFNGKYVSFRHAGGDYLNDYDNVLNVVGRFVRAMIIASNPELYKNEYMKKLSVLVSQTQTPRVKAIDKAREYLKLLQFVKTNGYPVVVGSAMFGLDKWGVSDGMPDELLDALDVLYWSNNYKRDVSAKAKKLAKQNILNYYSSILPADSPLMEMYNEAPLSGASLTYMASPASSLRQTIQILNSIELPVKGKYYNNDWAPIYHVEYFPLNHPLVSDSYKKLTLDYAEYMDKARHGGYVNEDKQAPIYYFSYGMLTDPDYLPGAELMGVAELRNFEFTMYAYANVEPKTGDKVYGALWKLDKNLLTLLDQIEDYPELYDRRTYPVYMDGKKYPAEVYLMTPGTLKYMGNTLPTQQYINTVLKGYKNAGIPTRQLYDALDFYGHYE